MQLKSYTQYQSHFCVKAGKSGPQAYRGNTQDVREHKQSIGGRSSGLYYLTLIRK
jgi:hypothetical protein